MTDSARLGAVRSRRDLRRPERPRGPKRLLSAAAGMALLGTGCVVGSLLLPGADGHGDGPSLADLAQSEAQGYGTALVSAADPGRDGGLGATAVDPNNPAELKAIAADMLGDYGWGPEQMTCLDQLWEKESNWNPLAENPDSGAYGIPQAWPAEKLATAGDDWRTNPVTQITWGLDYIEAAYGSPCTVWNGYTNWY
ncbi:hypothetical protein GCM10011490_25810 [Pseudoclavibacter endophyticus]|uniref:aggregation-promoting factor C-terminal-like domain-containing protein n=1 Tax=Pseudoclavibacter endophyticus TaxID=1778590 RepID=UPI00166EAFBF|nr:hypothetical protein [Pseudoclavibacter endophyticus]GGA73751.1 hypothetical protein GCM10011490_25810 [Pseudoclavibacter endophyticus]